MADHSEAARSWVSDVSNGEIVGFVLWVAVEFALGLTATLVILHRAVALPVGGHLSTGFLIGWAATWGGAMLGLSLAAGALVFRRTAPWGVLLTWPWLIGVPLYFAYMFGLSGQMDQGSRLCGPQTGGCDLSWGFGAAILAAAAAAVLGTAFVGAASVKRLLLRRRRAADLG